MEFINKYPYTDFHELNLDWILNTIKNIAQQVNDFTVFNNITWCGEWSAAKSYVKWSVVQDPDGNGYIALQAVPANVPINNKTYWGMIAKYSDLYGAFNSRIQLCESSLPYYMPENQCIIFGGQITKDAPLTVGDYHVYDKATETIDIRKL